jgi:hypothetical protein
VRDDTTETALKQIVWGKFHPPKPSYFLRIRNVRDEEETSFAIRRQWEYILETTPSPLTPPNTTQEPSAVVNVKLKAPKMFERQVNADTRWAEATAIDKFKRLAGLHGQCGLKVTGAKGEKVRFKIEAACTYTLVCKG